MQTKPCFAAGQFFLQPQHVLVRLEIRIGLGQCEHPSQHACQCAVGLLQTPHCSSVARIGARRLRRARRLIACLDHRIERFTLMRHVPLARFDQIRNQVISPHQLHVDLRERVLVAITRGDQSVVNRYCPKYDDDYDADKNLSPGSHVASSFGLCTSGYYSADNARMSS